jgi:aminoglycoside phosphotransferase
MSSVGADRIRQDTELVAPAADDLRAGQATFIDHGDACPPARLMPRTRPTGSISPELAEKHHQAST